MDVMTREPTDTLPRVGRNVEAQCKFLKNYHNGDVIYQLTDVGNEIQSWNF
jgi:hypothetical protein